jgi:hypothetical protein
MRDWQRRHWLFINNAYYPAYGQIRRQACISGTHVRRGTFRSGSLPF